jgi:hypothetical protein
VLSSNPDAVSCKLLQQQEAALQVQVAHLTLSINAQLSCAMRAALRPWPCFLLATALMLN